MSHDDPQPFAAKSQHATGEKEPSARRSLFAIPPPLKRIFDRFPLITYDDNPLPLRAPSKARDEHVLYVFATVADARQSRPSFNPSCLRWQTYLKLSGISHRIVASNNHASPSGALPFLLPAATDDTTTPPVPSNRLKRWTSNQNKAENKAEKSVDEDIRYEAYQSLLEGPVRVAWLYQLYLNPENESLLRRLCVTPCSTNPLVQATIAYQLRQAAETEIVKATGSRLIIEADFLRAAEEALLSLSTLLGEDKWFFGHERADVFDASIFAYTHLLLGGALDWEENRAGDMVQCFDNLVRHRDRIMEMYY